MMIIIFLFIYNSCCRKKKTMSFLESYQDDMSSNVIRVQSIPITCLRCRVLCIIINISFSHLKHRTTPDSLKSQAIPTTFFTDAQPFSLPVAGKYFFSGLFCCLVWFSPSIWLTFFVYIFNYRLHKKRVRSGSR